MVVNSHYQHYRYQESHCIHESVSIRDFPDENQIVETEIPEAFYAELFLPGYASEKYR
jgi:hypothetical protein